MFFVFSKLVDKRKPPLKTKLSEYEEAASRFKKASKKNDFNKIFWLTQVLLDKLFIFDCKAFLLIAIK